MFHGNFWPWRFAVAKGSGRTRRCFRPLVESLEGRLAPATIMVTTRADVVDPLDGERSLREAITQANAAAGADVIVLPTGVFRIGLAGVNENGNAMGDFDVTSSVTIRGAGASKTVIDGQLIDRVFDVIGAAPGSIRVVFQGLTVRSGSVSGNGGGVQAVNANLAIRDCVIAGNQASVSGGGVSYTDAAGSVAIVRSAVRGNVAGDDGAGIHCTAGALTVKSSTVRRNVAEQNGGGILAGNTATLIKTTLSDNIANSFGGGINAATVTLTQSTVSGNAALFGGGGVYARDATLINTTVSGNRIAFSGGGVRVIRNAALLNCTVVDNVAQQGGGLFHDSGGGTFTVKNTIVALNVVRFGGSGPDVFGSFLSQGHNFIGNGAGGGGFTHGALGDQVGTPLSPLNPKIGPLENNGGPTKTHALLRGSRALDRGANAGAPRRDQRGVKRPRDGDGNDSKKIDIGAFER